MSTPNQNRNEMTADEAGRASDKDIHELLLDFCTLKSEF
jgi:hypothetical protein